MTVGNELEGLAEPVRRDVAIMDERNAINGCWNAIHAELIRLARENVELRESVRKANSQTEHFERECYLRSDRAERAESELAALRKRVGDAPVAEARWAANHNLLCFEADDIGRGIASAMHGIRVRLVEESV